MTKKNKVVKTVGIISHGAYIPSLRLQRSAIADGIAWAAPGIKGLAKGERSVANWDENSITMSVEAARDCLQGIDRSTIGSTMLASTTLPFADRSNSGIAVDALILSEQVITQDLSGSRRAATSALIQALNTTQAKPYTLLLSADCRETKPGSTQEMLYGHGAAAMLIGSDEPIAVPLATASIHSDLVDQYRSSVDTDFDYALEERWVRDQGYMQIVPEAVASVLTESGIVADEVEYFILPASAAAAKGVAKACNFDNAEIVDAYRNELGDCGVAQALLMLSGVLDRAKADQHIILVGFGQGADVILLKTTTKITKMQGSRGTAVALANGMKSDNYIRFLVTRRQLKLDYGMRAERDNRTALSAFYRKRRTITSFMGGRCKSCNTLQFPSSTLCVVCGEKDSQQAESLAELTGTVKSFTEDWLAFTPAPPLIYGNITFPDGANVMMEFTDFAAGEVKVGMQVKMVFRIKDFDERRHFHRYFWKPTRLKKGAVIDG